METAKLGHLGEATGNERRHGRERGKASSSPMRTNGSETVETSCGDSRGYSHKFKNPGVSVASHTPAVLWMGGADDDINSQSP